MKPEELLYPFHIIPLLVEFTENYLKWYFSQTWLKRLEIDIECLESKINSLELKIMEKNFILNEDIIRP